MNTLNQLIRLNIEIEGLLRVLENRESSELRQIILEKFREYSALMEKLLKVTDTTEAPKESGIVDVYIPELNVNHEAVQNSDTIDECETGGDNESSTTDTEEQNQKSEVFSEKNAEVQSKSQPASSGIKLDELLSLRESADLKKAFTLNDKFRFRRELFGGNAEDFNDTINLISDMSNFEEAQQYLCEDLQWDMDNPEAKDFLSVVEKHFNSGVK